MTKRLSYKITWAQGGSKVDPNADTTHPSYIPNRYTNVGWKAEKPPEQWENFLNNITEEKVVDTIRSGIPIWADDVVYQPGAMVVAGAGILYVNESGKTTTGQDPKNGAPWQRVLSLLKGGIEFFVKEFTDAYKTHTTASNPHGDTIEGAGGITKDAVDTALGHPLDTRTIVYHKNRTGRVHSETPAQVGTLPTSGGVFTGLIGFLKQVILRTDIKQFLQLNDANGTTEFGFSNNSLHVDGNGDAWVAISGVMSQIVTEGNFTTIQNTVNKLFTLPTPYFEFHLRDHLSDVNSTGNWTLTASTEPVFDTNKGLVLTGNTILSQNFGWTSNMGITTYLVGSDATKDFAETFDTAMATIGGFSNFLNNLHKDITHVRRLVVYSRLTAFQKTSLVLY